jgi:hypothetical protein
MKGVGNGLGDIVTVVVTRIVIHLMIIETDTVLGQKEERKGPLEKRKAAKNILNNIGMEAGTPSRSCYGTEKENSEAKREEKFEGLNSKLLFQYNQIRTTCWKNLRFDTFVKESPPNRKFIFRNPFGASLP